MSSELVPFVKQPPTISKALRKKETLTLKEKAWVHNDLFALACGLLMIGAGIGWTLVPLTSASIGMLLVAAGTPLTVCGFLTWIIRSDGKSTPIGYHWKNGYVTVHDTPKRLTTQGRTHVCLLDRNRRNTPHRTTDAGKSLARQYSIWPELHKGEIVMVLCEHVYPGRFASYLRPWYVSIPSNSTRCIVSLGRPPIEDMMDKQGEIEAEAAKLEQAAYDAAIAIKEAERDVLMIRRT